MYDTGLVQKKTAQTQLGLRGSSRTASAEEGIRLPRAARSIETSVVANPQQDATMEALAAKPFRTNPIIIMGARPDGHSTEG